MYSHTCGLPLTCGLCENGKGALLLSQCTCKSGYFSTDLLGSNMLCSECGLGMYCEANQHRAPCGRGRYSAVTTASSCNNCAPLTFQNFTGASSCPLCPERTESDIGNILCRCSTGYNGPIHGPCMCDSSSSRYLELRVNSSLFNATGTVMISVYNKSNASIPHICGDGGAGCVPFSVFYTLDGSAPNHRLDKNSTQILCTGNSWKGDDCLLSWKSSMPLALSGIVHLRLLLLRQGEHPDACDTFGVNVTQYRNSASNVYAEAYTAGPGSPYSASVECNINIEWSSSFTYLPPLSVTISPTAAGPWLTCPCETMLCCEQSVSDTGSWMRLHGTGALNVSLGSLANGVPIQNLSRVGTGRLRYKICEAPVPASPPPHVGIVNCQPSGDRDTWPIYEHNKPLQFTVRSFVTTFSEFLTPLGKLTSNEFTFQVPVRHLVRFLPEADNDTDWAIKDAEDRLAQAQAHVAAEKERIKASGASVEEMRTRMKDLQAQLDALQKDKDKAQGRSTGKIRAGTAVEVQCADARAVSFLYSLDTPYSMADDTSGWIAVPLSSTECRAMSGNTEDGDGGTASARISWY
jgi:hypothetical protein